MRDRAVFTTAMSSISIMVAAQTTARVQRWVLCMCREAPGDEGGGGVEAHSPGCGPPGQQSEPANAGAGGRLGRGAAAPSGRIGAMDREELNARLDQVLVGGREKRAIVIADPDPAWPRRFDAERERIAAALGDRALRIEHIGSTAVPGLPAKPIVDVLLVVADSANEQAYLPALVDAGYILRIREPAWYEHRLFKGPDTDVNLHVFSAGCPEIERHLLFRDWLRGNEADRQLYARTKRELAQQDWKYTQYYADAKTAVIGEI